MNPLGNKRPLPTVRHHSFVRSSVSIHLSLSALAIEWHIKYLDQTEAHSVFLCASHSNCSLCYRTVKESPRAHSELHRKPGPEAQHLPGEHCAADAPEVHSARRAVQRHAHQGAEGPAREHDLQRGRLLRHQGRRTRVNGPFSKFERHSIHFICCLLSASLAAFYPHRSRHPIKIARGIPSALLSTSHPYYSQQLVLTPA